LFEISLARSSTERHSSFNGSGDRLLVMRPAVSCCE